MKEFWFEIYEVYLYMGGEKRGQAAIAYRKKQREST
jgi:hypothetical protein